MTIVTVEADASVDVDIESHSGASFFCRELVRRWGFAPPLRVLVAGCGAGHEAAAISATLPAEVDGVDVEDFVPQSLHDLEGVRYQIASVTDLPFDDGQFDAIFYHHVIEHVDDPLASLHELRRVLIDEGVMFVGTPNRNRLVSSVGAHRQSTWDPTIWNKLSDNIADWTARCQGKFRNELGAHAGFTRRELDRLLAPLFTRRDWVTQQYLHYKYQQHRFSSLFNLAAKKPWGEVLAPSIYAFCQP